MQTVEIQGFSYQERHGVLPSLTAALAACGGWIVDRRTLSEDATELRIEIRLRDALEIYTTLLSSGLELTRRGHEALTDLCTCHHHMAFAGETAQTITICLEINFLENVTLHSLLMTGGSYA